VKHQDFVVVIDLLRIPFRRKLSGKKVVRRSDTDIYRNQSKTLCYPMMVTIYRQRRDPKAREQQDRSACLGADARNTLEPCACGHWGKISQEIKG
jgi:hypothetical protein